MSTKPINITNGGSTAAGHTPAKASKKIKVFNTKMDKLIVEALLEKTSATGEMGLHQRKLLHFSTKHNVGFEKLKGRIHHLDVQINGSEDKSSQLSAELKSKWKSQRRLVVFSRIGIVAGLIASIALTVISIGCLASVVALPAGILLTSVAVSGIFYFLHKLAKNAARPPFVEKTKERHESDEASLVAEAVARIAKDLT